MDEYWQPSIFEGIHLEGNNIVWSANGRRVCRPATEQEKVLIAQIKKEELRGLSLQNVNDNLHDGA